MNVRIHHPVLKFVLMLKEAMSVHVLVDMYSVVINNHVLVSS